MTVRATRGKGALLVFEHLRDKILNLELDPGADIDELALVERIGVSRTPVREALIKLAAEDLVIVQPNRGAVVAPLNALDFPKLVEALDLSQRAVTRLAAQRRSAEDLERIRDAQDQVDLAIAKGSTLDIIVTNRDFHVAIAQACDNRYLAEQYERQLNIAMRFSRLPLGSEPSPNRRGTLSSHLDRVSTDHCDIVAAIADQNADRAEAVAHQHTKLFRSRMLEFLAQSDTDVIQVEVL